MDNAKKVLIVEDETLTAMAIQAYIEERGYRVVGLSASGEDAVRQAKEEEPDLILMDFRLAGRMDGMEGVGIQAHRLPVEAHRFRRHRRHPRPNLVAPGRGARAGLVRPSEGKVLHSERGPPTNIGKAFDDARSDYKE
jgi:hypothetical protein